MSRNRRAGLEVDYPENNSEFPESDMNGSDQPPDLGGVQVKFEPEDAEFENALGGVSSVSAGLLRSFPPPGMASSTSAAQWSGNSSAVRTQMRKIMEDKSSDSNKAAQNVHNVIENLLKKNEFLLAQNDAVGFKPNSRRGRIPGEVGRSKEVVFPSPGQSTTFSSGHLTQGRVTQSYSRSSPQRESSSSGGVPMGQLMRPKSPTRRCSIPEKDKSHFNLALMESRVGCEEGEKIFRVQEHEMVCAISSQTKFLDKQGRLVSSMDISYYWCNFCSFSTTSKGQLMQHVMEHRFHCKLCRYQSFSRADVIHHSTHTHPGFQETATITQYCTLLSDYLRIHNPKENILDANRKKRRGPPEDEENGGGEQPPASKVSKNSSNSLSKKKKQKGFANTYDLFDLNIEDLEETMAEEESGKSTGSDAAGSKSSSASSSSTSVHAQPDPPPPYHQAVQQSGTSSSSSSSSTAVFANQASRSDTSSPPVSQPSDSGGHPVITQVFSASNIPPSLAMETPTESVQPRATPSSSRGSSSSSRPSPSPSPTPPPPMNANSVGAGAMQNMRTNLYWSCGYCAFTSKSQSGIKDHSMRQHSGKPHRYVALIKSESEASAPSQQSAAAADDSNSSSADQGLELDIAEDDRPPEYGDGGDADQPDKPPVLVKQELEEESQSVVPIKVRFPTPRIQSKDSTSLKCYHCNYSSRILGPLRNHILKRHKGKCLVGLGGMNSKVFMCTRSDCTFRSSSGQVFINHSQECTPWMEPESANIPGEPHLLDTLLATALIAEEAQAVPPPSDSSDPSSSTSKVSFENFSCIYCKRLLKKSVDKDTAREHVMKCHGSQCLVVRDVYAHSKKKRSSVFLCRWCLWEGESKLDYDRHHIVCKKASESAGFPNYQTMKKKALDSALPPTEEGSYVVNDDDDDSAAAVACGDEEEEEEEETGEETTMDVDAVVTDSEDNDDMEPPELTNNNDQDSLDSLHASTASVPFTAERALCVNDDVEAQFSDPEEAPTLVSVVDCDEMPKLEHVRVSNIAASLDSGPSVLQARRTTLQLSRMKEILNRGIEYRNLSKKKHTKAASGEILNRGIDFGHLSKKKHKMAARSSSSTSSVKALPKQGAFLIRQPGSPGQSLKVKMNFAFRGVGSRPHFGKSKSKSKTMVESKKVTNVQCLTCRFQSDCLKALKQHISSLHGQRVCFSFRSLYHKQLHVKSLFFACPSPACLVYRYSEADIVRHYKQEHSSQPHTYLDPTYVPAPVKFNPRRLNFGGSSSKVKNQSDSKAADWHGRPSSTASGPTAYLCLYCEHNVYTGTVMEMKHHHLTSHPGLAVVFRDCAAYKGRKASRLSVCDRPLCDFSTYVPKELSEHTTSQHSSSKADRSPRCGLDRSFQCALCGWITTNDDLVYEHVVATHASEGGATVVTLGLGNDQRTLDERYISI